MLPDQKQANTFKFEEQTGNSEMIHICQSAYACDRKIRITLSSGNMVQGKYQYFLFDRFLPIKLKVL